MNEWDKDLKCVIICGGMGTRMLPITEKNQKTMVKINQKPLLSYVIDFWKDYANEFVFVTGFKAEKVVDYLNNLDLKHETIVDDEMKGIANAIHLAKDNVGEKFIVVLGDCVCSGTFTFPNNMDQGFGVWKTQNQEDIKRSYSIELQNGLITKVVEKPKEVFNDLCGMGFYFFDKKMFDYIAKTEPNVKSGKIEITDVIQTMIRSGEKISPVYFEGEYLNITYESDLEKAEKILVTPD